MYCYVLVFDLLSWRLIGTLSRLFDVIDRKLTVDVIVHCDVLVRLDDVTCLTGNPKRSMIFVKHGSKLYARL